MASTKKAVKTLQEVGRRRAGGRAGTLSNSWAGEAEAKLEAAGKLRWRRRYRSSSLCSRWLQVATQWLGLPRLPKKRMRYPSH